jgi:hypothetical protein
MRRVKAKLPTTSTATAAPKVVPAPIGATAATAAQPSAPLPAPQRTVSAPTTVRAEAPAHIVAPVTAIAAVTVTPVAEAGVEEKKIEQRLQETIDELKDFKTMTSGMVNEFIERLTEAKREIRYLRRTQKKPRPTNINGPKKPSSFEVPVIISEGLCQLFQVAANTKMSRNETTHRIHKYCKDNNLLQDGDQRVINPDEALQNVLSPMPEGEKLTFFNLQRYLKHNYTSA